MKRDAHAPANSATGRPLPELSNFKVFRVREDDADPWWLSLLASPESGSPLRLADDGGQLVSRAGEVFPIARGIPRFTVTDSYTESFGFQWNRFDVAQDEEDRRVFEAKTGVRLADLAGLTVLDAGCGGGRYARLVAQAGARVVAVDHSIAVEKARLVAGTEGKAVFLQADLNRLPLRPGSFDFVYSIGVLHHTPDTRAAFRALARMTRPGGRFSVWVYRRNTWAQELLNDGARSISVRMPRAALMGLCRGLAVLGAIPGLNRTLNKVLNFSSLPTWELRVCDNFDWYAPRYQWHHAPAEVMAWFRELGFEEIVALPPLKRGRVYRKLFERGWIVGSGVNVTGVRGTKLT